MNQRNLLRIFPSLGRYAERTGEVSLSRPWCDYIAGAMAASTQPTQVVYLDVPEGNHDELMYRVDHAQREPNSKTQPSAPGVTAKVGRVAAIASLVRRSMS